MPRLSIKNLHPSQKYAVQIRAVGENETSPWSRKFTFTATDDDVRPKVPTGFDFYAANGYFIATWDNVTKNVDESNSKIIRYGLFLTANGTTEGIQVHPSDGATTNYRLTYERARVLFGGTVTEITAKVRAVNKGEVVGNFTLAKSASLAIPDPPTDPVVEEVTDGLNISWTPPVNMANVDGYRVYMSTEGPEFTVTTAKMRYQGTAANFSYSTSTYLLHHIKIRSYSRFGPESIDCYTSGTPKSPYGPDETAPDVPTALSASLERTGEVAKANLTWSFNDTVEPNKDIMSFVIRYRKVGSGDDEWQMSYFDKTARSGSIVLPESYADYEFQIAALDFVANYSAFSASVIVSAGVPGPPADVTVTAKPGLGSVQLTWTESSADVTHGGYYEVTLATDNAFTAGVLNYRTGNTSIAVAGLTIGATYYYRVRAVDVTGLTSSWTATASFVATVTTPVTDKQPPASSPAATMSAGIGSLFISWTPITNNDEVTYEIHLSTSTGFTPNSGTKVGETTGSIVSIDRAPGGGTLSYTTPYYAKIVAKDADGAAAPGAESSAVSPRKSGTGDIITIIADQIGTGSLAASIITVGSGGEIRSTGYTAFTSGYKLSETLVDINSGTVNFKTLAAGTMTAGGLVIGAGGSITVDASGEIRSNTYAAGSTGWRIGSLGIELNDANSSVKANAIIGGTFSGGNFIVGSGGTMRSVNWNPSTPAGWQLGDTGLTMYSGTIYGASIETNQIKSINTGAPTPSGRYFSINASGYAEFAGANIYGNTIVSGSASHRIQSSTWSEGVAGWAIKGDGSADFNGATLNAGYITGGVFRTALAPNPRVWIESADSPAIKFYSGVGGETPGRIAGEAIPNGSRLRLRGSTVGGGVGTIDIGYTSTSGASIDIDATNTWVWGNFRPQNVLASGLISSGSSITALGQIESTTGQGRFGNGLFDTSEVGGGTTPANINTNGRVVRASTLAMKEEVQEMTQEEARSVLGLKSYTFKYKHNPDDGPTPDPRRYPGFIAEQGVEAGAELWVARQHKVERDKDGRVKNIVRDENGKPVAFRTADITVAHNVLIKDLYYEINKLREEVKSLRGRLDKGPQ